MTQQQSEGNAQSSELRAQSLISVINFSLNSLASDLPLIEDIMNCPLLKFIHFATHNCGYHGSKKDLIVNWIHPLFLKSKSAASQEDTPNWRQVMNGLFK